MGLPKITKPSDLRKNLYNTLARVSKGERHIVPTKGGEVVLLSRNTYDSLINDLELLKEFEEPIHLSELSDQNDVFASITKKYKLSTPSPHENSLDKKSSKKSR